MAGQPDFQRNNESPATHCANLRQKDSSLKKVLNARILIIGYDNERPLQPDLDNLKKTYSKFNWPMLVLKNYKKDSLLSFLGNENDILKYMQIENGVSIDLFIVHVLAHGEQDGNISTHDESLFNRKDVQDRLSLMKSLESSMKIYHFGPCRGKEMEKHYKAGNQVEQVGSSSESQNPFPFIRHQFAEPNTTFFFSTLEGYMASGRSTHGTFLVHSWCDQLNCIQTDSSLESVIIDTCQGVLDRALPNTNPETYRKYDMYAQTPVIHSSLREAQIIFGQLDGLASSSNGNTAPQIPGWYRDRNEDGSKRGPGRVYIFHDDAHTNEAIGLKNCFESLFPHLTLQRRHIKNGLSISKEIKNIADFLDNEFVVHFFVLTQVELKQEGVISLPCFQVEDVDLLVKNLTVEKCPRMCGQPKTFFFLDCNARTDSKMTRRAEVLQLEPISTTGQNHSDFLCYIARSTDVVKKLVLELQSQSQALIEEGTHLLHLLSTLTNSLNIGPEDFAPLTISTLLKRLSLPKVDSPYVEPHFIDSKFTRVSYPELLFRMRQTVQLQDEKRAYILFADAGFGKTRFAHEVSKHLKSHRVPVVHIKAKEHECFFSYNSGVLEVANILSNDGTVDPAKSVLILEAIDEICPAKRPRVLDFLKEAVKQFTCVLATSRTGEERHIVEALEEEHKKDKTKKIPEYMKLKFLDMTDQDIERFISIELRNEDNALQSWSFLKREITFKWTPQLLKLVAEYIRGAAGTPILKICNKFHIYWTIFNKRVKDSEKTLTNTDPLSVKIAHIKLAIGTYLEKHTIALKDDEKSNIDSVGLAKLSGEALEFSHRSWAEFLMSLALMAPQGMFNLGELSSEEKACVLTNGDGAVLEFLNQAFGVDLEEERGVFSVEKFVDDLDLANHLRMSGKGLDLCKKVCKENFCDLYFKYVVERMPDVLNQEDLIEKRALLFSALGTNDYYNKNDGGGVAGRIALDLIDQRGIDLKLFFRMEVHDDKNAFVQSLGRSNNFRVLERLNPPQGQAPTFTRMWQKAVDEALLVAAQYGQVEVMQVLISKGANLNKNKVGGCVLHCAAFFGMDNIFKFLLEKQKMDINLKSELEGKTPLHSAVQGGQLDMVRWLLLQPQTDVCAFDHKGLNALHQAVCTGDVQIVQLLLEDNRLNVDTQTHLGQTALHLCFNRYNLSKEIISLLLSKGAKVDCKDQLGATVLHLAADKGRADLVQIVLNQINAQVDVRNLKGRTPLHLAAKNGHREVVDLLLRARVDVNAVDEDGNSALHQAAYFGQKEVIKRLLEERSLRVEARNKKEELAGDVAKKQLNLDINFRKRKFHDVKCILEENFIKRMRSPSYF